MKIESINQFVFSIRSLNIFAIVSGLLIIAGTACKQARKSEDFGKKIIIEADISSLYYKRMGGLLEKKSDITIQYTPFNGSIPPANFVPLTVSERLIDGKDPKVKWVIYANQSILVSPPSGNSVIMSPGDSLHISYLYEIPEYSGSNNETLKLLNGLMHAEERIAKPRIRNPFLVTTLEDYIEWDRYLNNKLAIQLPLFELYKDKIPKNEFEYYSSYFIGAAERDRVDGFTGLSRSTKKNTSGLDLKDLSTVWDSTQYKPWAIDLRAKPVCYISVHDMYNFNVLETKRKFGFDSDSDSLNHKETRIYLYYTNAKQKYNGLSRERLMAFILDESTITEMGPGNPMAQLLLTDYYSQPGFPEYKQWVKGLESERIRKYGKDDGKIDNTKKREI